MVGSYGKGVKVFMSESWQAAQAPDRHMHNNLLLVHPRKARALWATAQGGEESSDGILGKKWLIIPPPPTKNGPKANYVCDWLPNRTNPAMSLNVLSSSIFSRKIISLLCLLNTAPSKSDKTSAPLGSCHALSKVPLSTPSDMPNVHFTSLRSWEHRVHGTWYTHRAYSYRWAKSPVRFQKC